MSKRKPDVDLAPHVAPPAPAKNVEHGLNVVLSGVYMLGGVMIW
jgi:hypothetical protein